MRYRLWIHDGGSRWHPISTLYRMYPAMTRLMFKDKGQATAIEKILDKV